MFMLRLCLMVAVLMAAQLGAASAQDTSLLPKYGSVPKTEAQKAADAKFLAGIDDYYKGDRRKAAEEASRRGWQALRQSNPTQAMRRFNQAWLIDHANGSALWGMAVIEANNGRVAESLGLFGDADKMIGTHVDFAADYAKALGIAGAQTKNDALLQEAFKRFARVYALAPEHTLNLQNWAITYFYLGNYAEAWKKLKLAETTPRGGELDPAFAAALQAKMPRPE